MVLDEVQKVPALMDEVHWLIENRDCRSLHAFASESKPKICLLVCCEREERVVGAVRIIPWPSFLRQLWAGQIIA